jgi:hypothetical protein
MGRAEGLSRIMNRELMGAAFHPFAPGGSGGPFGEPFRSSPGFPCQQVARALLATSACSFAMPAPRSDASAMPTDRGLNFKMPASKSRLFADNFSKFRRLSPINFGFSYNKHLWNPRSLLQHARCSFPTPKSPPLGFTSVKEVSHPAPSRGYDTSLVISRKPRAAGGHSPSRRTRGFGPKSGQSTKGGSLIDIFPRISKAPRDESILKKERL